MIIKKSNSLYAEKSYIKIYILQIIKKKYEYEPNK